MSRSLADLSFEEIERMLKSVNGDITGCDNEGNEYTSTFELWDQELKSEAAPAVGQAGSKILSTGWYSKAYNFWEAEANCPLSDDGVLGGYGKLTPVDVEGSQQFLNQAVKKLEKRVKAERIELKLVADDGDDKYTFERAVDCGAGIGRVSKHFLLHRFAGVDLVEQSPRLLHAAPEYVGAPDSERIRLVEEGLQDYSPSEGSSDLIWIQWVIGHLHDLDTIAFFRRCALGLRRRSLQAQLAATENPDSDNQKQKLYLQNTGMIILKDNVVGEEGGYTFVVDKDDRSVSRNAAYTKLLIHLAGLEIIHEAPQRKFPKELYPVMMYAMVPVASLT